MNNEFLYEDIADQLFIMNVATVDKLFALGADEFLLYSFYLKTAKWQKSTEVWANNEYVMKCLGWGLKKVRATKESLAKNGFVEQIRVVDNASGKVTKWKVKLKYIQGINHPGKNEKKKKKTIGAIPPVGQFKGQNNNNNKIGKDSLYSNNSTPILRNTIPYGNTITTYCPQGGNKPVSPCGDILGDKRPDGANDLPSPKKTNKPEDYGLVKFDISEIEFGDYERLVNWFEYNHREKSTGKVMRPYCKKMFKQMVNQAKEFANGIWFKAVDCIEAAVNNNNQGFGKAECGFFVKPKTDEDYELEESLARDYRTHPQDMPERIMRYKPMVLDLALAYCNEQIGKLQGWKSEEEASMNGLDPQNPSYERLRGYALEKIANYDRVITEYVNQIKWVEGEKNSLKTKRTC